MARFRCNGVEVFLGRINVSSDRDGGNLLMCSTDSPASEKKTFEIVLHITQTIEITDTNRQNSNYFQNESNLNPRCFCVMSHSPCQTLCSNTVS